MAFPNEILRRLRQSRVVAGFSVSRLELAVPLARALIAGGIDAIELMLRTPVGIQSIRSICSEVPEILVGAGTVLDRDTVAEVKAAGAHFGVSPGTNPQVVTRAQQIGLPFAPGITTPSDLEAAIELGCRFVKFFPAEASGGVSYLKSLAAPYSHLEIEYFPLGGINADNMLSYLSLPSVTAVGGSWIVNQELVEKQDWPEITARAKAVKDRLRSGASA